ncbi:hypothetical protein NQ314_017931 [Rhamnusium bicolor]|uniref:Uncharacterized protein n=1 Tax=Rhamnusium bicolor TaxID=1586634 RepID=A0AAV8WT09_9CUCU|nr:hypothetical protein NQ314_017931 [Rhamnusium bicolor]
MTLNNSTEVSDVIYNETDWLNYDNRAKKHLILMMIRSQRPLTCNAAAIGDMTLDTFKRVNIDCDFVIFFRHV